MKLITCVTSGGTLKRSGSLGTRLTTSVYSLNTSNSFPVASSYKYRVIINFVNGYVYHRVGRLCKCKDGPDITYNIIIQTTNISMHIDFENFKLLQL